MNNENLECKVEHSSGNVFKDIGLPNPEIQLIKANLAHKINSILKEQKLTQKEAAKILCFPQCKISALKRHKMYGISLEKFIIFLIKLNYNVNIDIKKGNGNLRLRCLN